MGHSATLNLMVVGYLVSLPVVAYGITDLARIPARIYHYTAYSRRVWITVILAGYACFGFGGILMTGVWLRSSERAELRDDLVLDSRWERPDARDTSRTRAMRRRERQRRHRWAAAAVSLPVVFAVAATATRVR